VEDLARCSGQEEREVAHKAVHLAANAGSPMLCEVSYYLLADGVTRRSRLTSSPASAPTGCTGRSAACTARLSE
jgi:hypothetical protein